MAGDADAAVSKPGTDADDLDDDDEEEEEGSFGSMVVNMYYGLMNLSITLGAVAMMLVAYWLFKWANVRPNSPALHVGQRQIPHQLCARAFCLRTLRGTRCPTAMPLPATSVPVG